MTASIVLDWRSGEHASKRTQRCRLCTGFTVLRDDAGAPSHKVCAEQELEQLAERRTRAR